MAAGDLALRMLLTASDLASAVVVDMAATYNDAILSMIDATTALGDSFEVIEVTLTSLDATIASVDLSLATLDATVVSIDGSLASLDASAAGVDAALAGIDAAAAGADAALAGTGVAAAGAAISMKSLNAAQNLVGNVFSKLQGPAMMGALALAAAGIAAVKMAGDWESSTNTLVTGAGEIANNLGLVRQGMLQISTDTGTTTKQLVSGMFMIESAGYHGADGLNVLKAAAMGAKVGNADLGVVADSTTTIMTDFGLKSTQASVAVNTMIATVSNGKTTMNALAGSLSQILPTASAARIGLSDVMGAMATMTGEGVPAANAATYLRQTIIALQAPSKQTVTALKDVGLSSTQIASDMQKSLPMALKEITDAVGKKFPEGSAAYVAAMKNIAGGSKQMQGILDLTGTHMQTFQGDVKNIAGAVQQGGKSIAGWSQVQASFNQQMDRAKAAGEAFLITLGTRLMPIFGQLMSNITPMINGLMAWETRTHGIENALNGLISAISTVVSVGAGMVSFFQHNQAAMIALSVVLIAVAGAIAGMLVAAFVAWAIAAWSAAVATLAATWPILLIGALIALVVVGIILAIQHWGQIMAWLKGVWSAFAAWFGGIMSAIGTFFHGIWEAIANFFVGIWNRIIAFLQAAWNWIVNAAKIAFLAMLAVILGPIVLVVALIVSHWTQIKAFLAGLWNGIVNLAKTIWNAIVTAIQTAIQTVVGWFLWLYNHNYYFKDLVDGILILFNAAKAFLIAVWTTITTWLVNAWNTIKNTAIAVWTGVTNAIHTAITAAWNFILSIWTTVTTWIDRQWRYLTTLATLYWNLLLFIIQAKLQQAQAFISAVWNSVVAFLLGIWNRITSQVSAAWSNISSIFASAWSTYISGPLSNLWNSLVGWFSNLASSAVQWGANIIQGFINGIMSMVGDVAGAAQNIVSTVAGFLGFHSPARYGEGQHIIEWGQNLVKGFVSGMDQAQPLLTAQLNSMISAPGNIGYSGGNAGAGNAFALSGGHTIVVEVHPVAAAIHLDGRKVGESNMKYQGKEVRIQGGYRNS